MSQAPISSRPSASSLLGSMSLLSGGVADIMPPATQGGGSMAAPLRRMTARQQAEIQMEARASELVRSVGALPQRVLNLLLVLFCLASAFCLAVFIVWCRAIAAPVYFDDKPCDQPGLKYYAFISFIWSVLTRSINQALLRSPRWRHRGVREMLALKLVLSIPGWTILAWGCYMVVVSKTCAATNPDLFYATKDYIWMQVFLCIIIFALVIVMSLGARHFILPLSRLFEGPGCKEAVMKLPKIPFDSEELIDPEDGNVKSCPICFETFRDGSEVVRCPCGHHFHTECLASWCSNHVDCPMCRAPVGEPDEQV